MQQIGNGSAEDIIITFNNLTSWETNENLPSSLLKENKSVTIISTFDNLISKK